MAKVKTKDLTLDLSKKFGNKTVSLSAKDNVKLTFSGDVEGQIVYAESGSNIVVTAYGTKSQAVAATETYTYKKTETIIADYTPGDNDTEHASDKYTVAKKTYEYDFGKNEWVDTTAENAVPEYKTDLTDGQEVGTSEVIEQYVKTAGSETEANKNNDFVYDADTVLIADNSTTEKVVDTSKILGKVTYKNGAKVGSDGALTLITDKFTVSDLLTQTGYTPSYKSKNKTYTGSFLSETVSSTNIAETFNLGKGTDEIKFSSGDELKGFGKDTVNMTSGEKLTLNFTDIKKDELSVVKEGSNFVVKAARDVAATETYTYQRVVETYTANDVAEGSEQTYTYTKNVYLYNNETGTFNETADASKSETNVNVSEDNKKDDSDKYLKFVNGSEEGTEFSYKAGDELDKDNAYTVELGSVILKNLASKDLIGDGSLTITAQDGDATDKYTDAATAEYEVTGKKKKYTGTYLSETATSLSANETFALGLGEDTIKFAAKEGRLNAFGKDTVNLVKGANLTLDFAEDATVQYSYKKSGNNAIVTAARAVAETGEFYLEDGKITTNATHSVDNDTATGTFCYKENDDGSVDIKNTQVEGYTAVEAGKTVYSYQNGENTVYTFNATHDVDNTKVEVAVYKDKSGEYTVNAQDAAKTTTVGSVTLKNYYKLGEDSVTVGTDSLKGLLEGIYAAIADTSKKGNKSLTGTFLDEVFTGGNGANKINTGAGTDIVNAGKGNDTITLGAGNKTVKISGGDGNDTIKGLSNANSLTLNLDNMNVTGYTKSGNNLVVEHNVYTYKDGSETVYTTDAIREVNNAEVTDVVYSYTGDEGKIVYTNLEKRSISNTEVTEGTFYYKEDEDDSVDIKNTQVEGYTAVEAGKTVYSYQNGEDTVYTFNATREVANEQVTGTLYLYNGVYTTEATHEENNTLVVEKTTIADYFKGTNADKVTGVAVAGLKISGKGSIAGTAYDDVITGSAKADKITTGAGTDIVNAGKGNDTITINGAGDKTLNFDRNSGKDTVVFSNESATANIVFEGEKYDLAYTTNGKDLIVTANYEKDGKTKASSSVVTVKDYVAADTPNTVKVNGTALDFTGENSFLFNSNVKSVTGTKYNDTYKVVDLNKSVDINDLGGNNDKLVITSNIQGITEFGEQGLTVVFDVLKDDTTVLPENNDLTTLHIIRSDITGGIKYAVNIQNYFEVTTDDDGQFTGVTTGDGKIESIVCGESAYDISKIDDVRSAVASWLSDNDYDSAYAALQDENADIASLLKVYQTGEYTAVQEQVTP